MTTSALIDRVNEARASASLHASHCEKLIADQGLVAVLAYCQTLSVEPPNFSLTAASAAADKRRMEATRKLSDTKWWERSLETTEVRKYESEKHARGDTTRSVSDDLALYRAVSPRKR